MRGKHAAAASGRRDREELEQRAQSAERRVARAEAALTELRETSERRIANLRSDIAQLRKDRDAAASPAVAQAEEQIRALMRARDAAIDQAKTVQDRWNACVHNLRDVLTSAGFTGIEATEILLATVVPDGMARTVHSGPKQKSVDPEKLRALQAARGERHATDPLSGLRAQA